MYHSPFYDMLYHINAETAWRHLLRSSEPDLHMKDIEILLRGFAMLIEGESYAPSMVKFLNQFSRKCESQIDPTRVAALETDEEFLQASLEGTTRKANVDTRLNRARTLVSAL